jgi:hypothetical protein
MPRLFMRAMLALVLHLGGFGKYVSQIWGQTVCSQESRDLQIQHVHHHMKESIMV